MLMNLGVFRIFEKSNYQYDNDWCLRIFSSTQSLPLSCLKKKRTATNVRTKLKYQIQINQNFLINTHSVIRYARLNSKPKKNSWNKLFLRHIVYGLINDILESNASKLTLSIDRIVCMGCQTTSKVKLFNNNHFIVCNSIGIWLWYPWPQPA